VVVVVATSKSCHAPRLGFAPTLLLLPPGSSETEARSMAWFWSCNNNHHPLIPLKHKASRCHHRPLFYDLSLIQTFIFDYLIHPLTLSLSLSLIRIKYFQINTVFIECHWFLWLILITIQLTILSYQICHLIWMFYLNDLFLFHYLN
jgi:hypothetical protein